MVQMPVMDGFTASGHRRDLDAGDSDACVIIALTADATTEGLRACLDSGMDGILRRSQSKRQVLWSSFSS
jgi:CheY-like chemotaxis protein